MMEGSKLAAHAELQFKARLPGGNVMNKEGAFEGFRSPCRPAPSPQRRLTSASITPL